LKTPQALIATGLRQPSRAVMGLDFLPKCQNSTARQLGLPDLQRCMLYSTIGFLRAFVSAMPKDQR
jgi:hypothetical protein